MTRMLAQLTAQAGLATVAAPGSDPDTVGHIHDPGSVVAGCGYDYTGSTGGSPWDPLCWSCAQQHTDEQWVRSCLAGSGMPALAQSCDREASQFST